jgi:hypothetical protein
VLIPLFSSTVHFTAFWASPDGEATLQGFGLLRLRIGH